MQTVLEDWCAPNKRVHNIFYINWEKHPKVSWLLNKPNNINFKKNSKMEYVQNRCTYLWEY